MDKDKWIYLLIRSLSWPIGYMPWRLIRFIGRFFGLIAFYAMHSYRKRTLSNLALASDLKLSQKKLLSIAKRSFQNLAINCLEYPKLSRLKKNSTAIHCENPEIPLALNKAGKGPIFFCGHQANWEVLFLDGSSRMKGVAIGKPINNPFLYRWILSIRERFGGKIIDRRNAVKEGFKALKKGLFLGIVGDQGMPDSGYHFPFFGRRAWTSTAPALLSYRTGAPIIFASIKRTPNGYKIRYSDPLFPNTAAPMEQEVIRLMNATLSLLEQSIKETPDEWLWQHNRYKQQTMHNLYRRFRQDCICVIAENTDLLTTIKQIYPSAFLTLFLPQGISSTILADETIHYSNLEETLLPDFRFKLVFNFTDSPLIRKHYEKFGALEVLNLADLKKIAQEHLLPQHTLIDILQRALCRPNSIWKKEIHAS